MADNITAPAAGSVLATDDIGGVHYPRTKISIGADGSASDVSDANPMPVDITTPSIAVTGTFWQATQPVSLASVPLPAGAATAAAQGDIVTAIAAVETAIEAATYFPATQPVSAVTLPLPTGAATEAKQDAIVSAIGSAEYYPVTQPISAASLPLPSGAATEAKQDDIVAAIGAAEYYPATQLVSGPLTDSELRASAVPVSASALPLPSGAATSAKQDSVIAAISDQAAATQWFPITPADSDLATIPDAIFVGGAGDLVLRGSDAVDVPFAVSAGTILPLRPTQVRAATTATGIIGLIN